MWPAIVSLQCAQRADREERDAGTHEERTQDAERDVTTEILQRVDRLLLRVGDDELSQLANRLLRIVGHAQPFEDWRSSFVLARPAVQGASGVSPRDHGGGTR